MYQITSFKAKFIELYRFFWLFCKKIFVLSDKPLVFMNDFWLISLGFKDLISIGEPALHSARPLQRTNLKKRDVRVKLLVSRRSTAVVQSICNRKVGSSILSAGTIFSHVRLDNVRRKFFLS
jgi:hypothetical protein